MRPQADLLGHHRHVHLSGYSHHVLDLLTFIPYSDNPFRAGTAFKVGVSCPEEDGSDCDLEGHLFVQLDEGGVAVAGTLFVVGVRGNLKGCSDQGACGSPMGEVGAAHTRRMSSLAMSGQLGKMKKWRFIVTDIDAPIRYQIGDSLEGVGYPLSVEHSSQPRISIILFSLLSGLKSLYL
ncbi:uncharacterized protein LOC135138920 [Zophobas morio]|uniref:uncharacterized protein LOC135138920 n=1 Tax=Zophobas morio TaxID=2755281 RepID=UPI003082A33E